MGQIDKSSSSSSRSKPKDVLLVTLEFSVDETSQLLKIIKQHPHIKIKILGKSSFDSLPPEILHATKYLLGVDNLPTPEQVPNLQFVQLYSAGVNHLVDTPLWKWKLDEVKWCSASGVHGPIIGEYVVMAILTHFHRYISAIDSFQGAGHWPEKWPGNLSRQKELYQQTVGIVGYGAIGRNVGKLLKGFNVNIITLNSSRKSTPEERRQKKEFTVPGTGDIPGDIPSKWYSSAEPEDKRNFFEDADVVVVSAPYTPATKHLVDAKALGSMKKTSLIVNISRGELIDQDALIKVLKNKEIGGAALDVVTPEPYPAGGALLTEFGKKDDKERVVLTPHISGHTERYTERVIEILQENLKRLEKGKTLLNLVDRRKGY
jgi:phosphoglycerate dehydrogenase-like enzyme